MANLNLGAFILCAGDARRFNGELKQLLPISATSTILSRQLAQLETRKIPAFVVTHDETIRDYALACNAHVIIPANRDTTCNSALSTQYRWSSYDHILILLGDVIFSTNAFNLVVNNTDSLKFFGNEFEIYGFSFAAPETQTVVRILTEGSLYPHGKIRYAYRALIKKPWNKGDRAEDLRVDPYIKYINDGTTCDCDTESHYRDLKRKLWTNIDQS